jgi:hypothetical protein
VFESFESAFFADWTLGQDGQGHKGIRQPPMVILIEFTGAIY